MVSFERHIESLTKEEVINYLWQTFEKKGYKVIFDRHPVKEGWTIVFSPIDMVGIRPGDSANRWGICAGPLLAVVKTVSTIEELAFNIENRCKIIGINLSVSPQQHHVSNKEPFTVWSKLAGMIGLANIESIFDPYLDVKALRNLIFLSQLGTKYAADLKLLTSRKDITKGALSKFNAELSINAQLKNTKIEHCRLIFLSDGRCISPDFSLNQEKTGTISTINDVPPKRKIFNKAWEQGSYNCENEATHII